MENSNSLIKTQLRLPDFNPGIPTSVLTKSKFSLDIGQQLMEKQESVGQPHLILAAYGVGSSLHIILIKIVW